MQALWVNGVLAEADAPCIAASDRGAAYGDGLFATMRVSHGKIMFLIDHLNRLQQGALRLGFAWQVSYETQMAMLQAAQDYPNACLKLWLSRGPGGRGYQAPDAPQVQELLSVQPLPNHYADWQRSGVCLATSKIQLAKQPRLAGIKHLNRLEQVLIKQRPLPSWADDWLVLDCDEQVIESSMANLFFIQRDKVYTPALTHSGVSGVMRQQVIKALLELGYEVSIEPIGKMQLSQFQHAFITNSLLGCVDVTRIDNLQYHIHPVTSLLRRQLRIEL